MANRMSLAWNSNVHAGRFEVKRFEIGSNENGIKEYKDEEVDDDRAGRFPGPIRRCGCR